MQQGVLLGTMLTYCEGGAKKTKSAWGEDGGKHEKEGRTVHGPRRGGFYACEIVANAYRSRPPLSFSRQPSRLSFAFAVFLHARPSFFTPMHAKQWEAKKEEGE